MQQQKVSTSVKADVDEQWAGESHQLQDQKTDIVPYTMDVQVYRAAKVTTTNRRHFWVYMT
jgi:hypothetical protein